MSNPNEKPVKFVDTARDDLLEFPYEVVRAVGVALGEAQSGGMATHAKTLKGFGGTSVVEVVEGFQTDTYRAVYTVKFKNAIYVLHCFQKKAKKGVAISKPDMDLISAA